MPDGEWLKEPGGFLKIAAFILSVASLGIFIYSPFFDPIHDSRVAILTTSSNCMVLFYYLSTYILDHIVPGTNPRSEITFLSVNGFLSILTGSNAVKHTKSQKLSDNEMVVLIYGIIMLLLGLLLLLDAFFSFVKFRKEKVSSDDTSPSKDENLSVDING